MVNCKIDAETQRNRRTLYYRRVPMINCDISLPVFSGNCSPTALSRMNRTMAGIRRFTELRCTSLCRMAVQLYLDSLSNDFPFRQFELQTVYEITYNENCALSLYYDRYEYTGGAHGITPRSSQTFDTRNGAGIPLSAYFPPGSDYEMRLEDAVIRQIREQIASGQGNYFENYPELVRQSFSSDHYYLVPGGIAVYFQQYEIAPYASGIPVFVVPWRAVGAQPPHCRHG